MFAIDKTENKQIETVLPCQAAPFLFDIKSAYFDVNPTIPNALGPPWVVMTPPVFTHVTF